MMTTPSAPPAYDQAVKFEMSDEKSPLKESDSGVREGQEPNPAAHGGPAGQPIGPEHIDFKTAANVVVTGVKVKSLFKRAISLPTKDEQEEMARNFSETSIRAGFLRKVYSILMVQLSITVGFICLFTFHPDGRWFVENHVWLLYTCMGLSFVFLIPLVCITSLRRSSPTNYIILLLFTLCEAVMVGMVTSLYDQMAVLIAVGLTAGVTLVLTIFAIQTKLDFTGCRGALACLLFILIAFGVIMIFIPGGNVLNLVYGSVGAFIFSLYLIYDTQMMLGGSHKYSISPEEYVFAALALYLDILNIFLYILRIVGAANKN